MSAKFNCDVSAYLQIRVKAKSLDEFRKEWKKEIEKSPHHVPKKDLPNGEEVDQIKENDEDKVCMK